MKTRQELIRAYIEFFKSKNHKEIPSASLIPENDPTVLFTTAGMHPLVPFLLGQPHPLGKRLVDVQKCIRTGDIDAVGDEVHHTFFEMLGNWSLGDYWKEDAIKYTFEFHTKILGIPKEKYAVSVFQGDKTAPKDDESAKVWLSLGIPKERIAFLPKEDNWWGPAGAVGPCGPDTEQFYWTGSNNLSEADREGGGRLAGGVKNSSPKSGKEAAPKKFDPKDKRWVEIGNNVLMQYVQDEKGNYNPAKQKNVDFGGGVERTLAILNGLSDDYQTTIFKPIIEEIEKLSKKKYLDHKKEMRIIADHIRAATFIIGDVRGIKPSNTEHGYVVRRLIRRAIRYAKILGIQENFTAKLALAIIPIYPDYSELEKNKNFILTQLDEEENRFNATLEKGLKKFEEITSHLNISNNQPTEQGRSGRAGAAAQKSARPNATQENSKKIISGTDAFLLFQSFGFPIEMTEELAAEKKMKVDIKGFEEEFKKHQELSRTASAGVFKSGLAVNSEQTTKLHTATHLLNEVLRRVLNEANIKQKGSNINPERLRFDFSFSRKLTNEELKEVETLVNKKISESLEVKREELPLQKALESGAQAEFGAKYPDVVSVYTVLDSSEPKGWFSKEICTGPHVKNTNELGNFKILKEEAVAAGVRRIKATVSSGK